MSAMRSAIARGCALLFVMLCAFVLADSRSGRAQGVKPATGEMRWGLHVTLVARWLDPAETEAFNTPYMVMYAVHDAMVKPMPPGPTTRRRSARLRAFAWPRRS